MADFVDLTTKTARVATDEVVVQPTGNVAPERISVALLLAGLGGSGADASSEAELWTGNIAISTAHQWNAAGTVAVPDAATWILWNGGKLAAAADDAPNADWKWINAADWRALTAAAVGDALADGTGMLFTEWVTSDISPSPSFSRRDVAIGRTATNTVLISSGDASEDFVGASIRYVTGIGGTAAAGADGTIVVANPSGSDGVDLTRVTIGADNFNIAGGGGSGISQSDADTRYARQSENLSDLDSAATSRTNLGLGTAATDDTGTADGDIPLLGTGGTLADARIPAGIARDAEVAAAYAALAGATFTGVAAGIDPTADQHFATKAYVDSRTGTPSQDHTNYGGVSTDAVFTEAEFTTTSQTHSIMVPTYMGERYIAIAVPDAEGDITNITQGGIPIFGSWQRITGTLDIGGVAHKVWRTTAIQNDLASGITYVITQA